MGDRSEFKRSDRPVAERLGLAPGSRLLAIGLPLPGSDAWAAERVDTDADVVIAICLSVRDVLDLVPGAWAARRSSGRLWLAYQKGRRDFTRNDLGKGVEALGLGLTWFRQTAIDATWSGIWFKHRSEFRTLHR